MALYDIPKTDGIQLGKRLDRCFKCEKIKNNNGDFKQTDSLEYQEVFKLHLNGIEYVACMDHFKEMLGDYSLTKKEENKKDKI